VRYEEGRNTYEYQEAIIERTARRLMEWCMVCVPGILFQRDEIMNPAGASATSLLRKSTIVVPGGDDAFRSENSQTRPASKLS